MSVRYINSKYFSVHNLSSICLSFLCKGFFFILDLFSRGILKKKPLNVTICNIIMKAFWYSVNLNCTNPVKVLKERYKSIRKQASLQIQDASVRWTIGKKKSLVHDRHGGVMYLLLWRDLFFYNVFWIERNDGWSLVRFFLVDVLVLSFVL